MKPSNRIDKIAMELSMGKATRYTKTHMRRPISQEQIEFLARQSIDQFLSKAIIQYLDEQAEQKDHIQDAPKMVKIVVPPTLYRLAVENWGKEEADRICQPNQKVQRTPRRGRIKR